LVDSKPAAKGYVAIVSATATGWTVLNFRLGQRPIAIRGNARRQIEIERCRQNRPGLVIVADDEDISAGRHSKAHSQRDHIARPSLRRKDHNQTDA
jgi:hypothetical protein